MFKYSLLKQSSSNLDGLRNGLEMIKPIQLTVFKYNFIHSKVFVEKIQYKRAYRDNNEREDLFFAPK